MLLLSADNGDLEASHRLVQGMYAEVGRIHRLVEDLLTLTRLDERRALFRWTQADVGALVEAVCEQAALGQEVSCKVAPGLPNIEADADRLKQVLLILVDNALKFTPVRGQVTLVVRQESSATVLAGSAQYRRRYPARGAATRLRAPVSRRSGPRSLATPDGWQRVGFVDRQGIHRGAWRPALAGERARGGHNGEHPPAHHPAGSAKKR